MRAQKTTLSEGEEIVLRSMFPKGKELTIKELMQKTPYSSYERNNTYARALARKGILEEKKVGKTLVYSLMPGTWASKRAYSAYAFERAENFSVRHKIIAQALQEITLESDMLIVFGSYARGTERKESDIDLMLVASDKEKLEITVAGIKRKYGLPIHSIILPKMEFAKIKHENKELWNSFVTHGIVFIGHELFYHYAYENE